MKKITTIPRFSSAWFNLYDRLSILLLSVFFSLSLTAARIIHSGTIDFLFLVWNLLLAIIPFIISSRLAKQDRMEWNGRNILMMTLWILFVPNSFYLVTDLFHLKDHFKEEAVPGWFDLALIFSYAWNGLMIGLISVRQIQKLTRNDFTVKFPLLFVYPVMWLNGMGIYIGRYLRYNSWDIVSNPFHLLHDSSQILLHPIIYRNALGMVSCYSLFITLVYFTLLNLKKNFS